MSERNEELIERLLVALMNARNSVKNYPAASPSVARSVDGLLDSLGTFFAQCDEDATGADEHGVRRLFLEIDRETVHHGRLLLGEDLPRMANLATELYRLGVERLAISSTVGPDELQRFLEVTCLSPEDVAERGGFASALESRGVAGVEVSLPPLEEDSADPGDDSPDEEPHGGGFDMLDYLRSVRALRTGAGGVDQDAADIAGFFTDIAEGSDERMVHLMRTLSDPARLAVALTHVFEVRSRALEAAPGSDVGDLLGEVFDRISEIVAGLPAEMRATYRDHFGVCTVRLEEDVRRAFLEDALAPSLGNGGLADDVLSTLPNEYIAEGLLDGVQFHGVAVDSTLAFLDEQIGDARRRRAIGKLIARGSADNDSANVQRLLDALRDAAPGAPGPEQATGEELAAREAANRSLNFRMELDAATLAEVRAQAVADFEGAIPLHAARALMELYISPTLEGNSKRTSRRLSEMLLGVLESEGYDFIAEALRVFEEELPEGARDRVLPQMEGALVECSYPQHVNRILLRMRKSDQGRAEYRHLVFLLEHLGDQAIEQLFLRLELETDRAMRMFYLELFALVGDRSLPLLQRKMGHRDWFVVRNVVSILGKLESRLAIDSLVGLLDHADIRVRREVVRALARVGGRDAEDALISLMDDEEPELRRLAVEWLGYMKSDRSLVLLRERLARSARELLQDMDAAIGMVHAIGSMGGVDDIALVKRLAPGMSFRADGKRKELVEACKEAVAKLRDPGRGTADVPGRT